MPSGGGFGRRYYPDFALEAAFISKRTGGAAVKMMWTREDDQRCNMVHPWQQLEYQAALDGNNRLHAWYEKEVRTYTWGSKYEDPQLPWFAYDIPNIRYDFEALGERELMQSCAWRGVMHHGKALSECFIDEIAHAVRADPYEFRLSLLTPGRTVQAGYWVPLSSDRLRRVLRLTAERADYHRALGPGEGKGIALCPYGDTCCAAVARVTVRDGKLTVNHVTLGVDCGKVINPSGAQNQLVGGVLWGLTALLHGGVPIRKGRATRSNFHQNALVRMDECPPVDVFFAPSQEQRPRGIGEVSTPLAVPAVLNAIFSATGRRIRKIPVPEDAFASTVKG
jgi:CO/xanthine dehydrogenase Mo-binding subunit